MQPEKEPTLSFGLGISRWSRPAGFNTITRRHTLAWTCARRMFNPCSLGRWQFVNSLFISELLEIKPHDHLRFSNVDSTWTEKRAKKLFTATQLFFGRVISFAKIKYCYQNGVVSVLKVAKQPLSPFPWICPVRAYQLIKVPDFSGPCSSYIGCRTNLRRISLVPMITADRSPISGVLRRAKSCTIMSCEYNVDIHPVTDNFYSMVNNNSVRLFLCADTGHCFTFIIHLNLMSCCSHNFDGTVADELMGKVEVSESFVLLLARNVFLYLMPVDS